MRRAATLLLALSMAGLQAASVGAAEVTPSTQAAIGRVAAAASDHLSAKENIEFNYIFSGGGTPLSNGVFFPGTTICDANGCTELTPVPEIKKGTDITYVNLDEGTVSNAHRIVCKIRTKRGRPKCFSEQLDSTGEQTLLVTSHLKPGKYGYFCSIHAGMEGTFQVIK